jgi:hypothetical protein
VGAQRKILRFWNEMKLCGRAVENFEIMEGRGSKFVAAQQKILSFLNEKKLSL